VDHPEALSLVRAAEETVDALMAGLAAFARVAELAAEAEPEGGVTDDGALVDDREPRIELGRARRGQREGAEGEEQ
jgi:hypothetical protein